MMIQDLSIGGRMFLARLLRCVFLAQIALVAATTANAQNGGQERNGQGDWQERTELISVGIGYYDVFDNVGDSAADFRLEFRPDLRFLINTPTFQLKPFIAGQATSDGGLFGLGGILLDTFIGDRWVITPSFGAGAYSNGDGGDLGNTIQFRSQIEGGYRFRNKSRLALALSHISNAGLGDDNPGVEIVTLYYHFPLRVFPGF